MQPVEGKFFDIASIVLSVVNTYNNNIHSTNVLLFVFFFLFLFLSFLSLFLPFFF